MNSFLILEAGNMTIAAFFLLIAVIISTRPFVAKNVKKFLFVSTVVVFSLLILGHYKITTDRMSEVKTAFNNNKEIVCENRVHRKAAQSLKISKDLDWSLDGDNFKNPKYTRVFHTSRCIVK
jgi:hypothetical protein